MIKSAIFDVDGTLLDSMQMWIHYGHDLLASKGIKPPEDIDEIIQYFSLRETAEYMSERFDIGSADSLEEDARRMTEDFYFNRVQPKPGVAALLEALSIKGVRMYIATATYRSLICPALERVGILKYFDGVITCPEVGHGKDRPDVFLAALKAMDADLEGAWVFEDAMHAVKTAKSAGFSVCVIYDKTEDENKEELKKLCDVYCESFEEFSVDEL